MTTGFSMTSTRMALFEVVVLSIRTRCAIARGVENCVHAARMSLRRLVMEISATSVGWNQVGAMSVLRRGYYE
ncbi:MAG: hypothetical protein ACHQX3_00050, partial [Nitrospirales bacterium]